MNTPNSSISQTAVVHGPSMEETIRDAPDGAQGLMRPPMIIKNFPPNIEEIRKHFPIENLYGVIFAFAPDIYVPSGHPLTDALFIHECVHIKRQGDNPTGWWTQYIADIPFRIEEEIVAHQAEYHFFCLKNKDRNLRSNYLVKVARRMAAPMYGSVIDFTTAKKRIGGGK